MKVLGDTVADQQALGGGDLSRVSLVTLASGRRVVVKVADGAGREAEMLEAIGGAGVPCPEVYERAPHRLVMSHIQNDGRATTSGWKYAGRAVRLLHDTAGTRYGWHEDHAFGEAAIPNAWSDHWPAFWAERRLLAWAEALPTEVAKRLETLAKDLHNRLPAQPKPSLLHGDLWSGNLLFHDGDFAALIDPASSYGHAEVDLALLALFGGLNDAFLQGYGDSPDPERQAVYQLWPATVHLRLFGQGYRGMVDRLLSASGV